MIDLSAIGKLIKTRRKSLGLSQTELAEIAQVSRGFIRRLENADYYELTFVRLMNVLEALDLEFTITPKEGIESLENVYDTLNANKKNKSKLSF